MTKELKTLKDFELELKKDKIEEIKER